MQLNPAISRGQIGGIEGFAGTDIIGQLALNYRFVFSQPTVLHGGRHFDRAGLPVNRDDIRLDRFQRHQQQQGNRQQQRDRTCNAGHNPGKAAHLPLGNNALIGPA